MSAADIKAMVRKAAAAALNAQAEVAHAATVVLVPKETLALAKSIEVTKATARSLVSQVSTDSPYAIYQHESLHLRHKNGRSKFMEAAVHAEVAAIAAAGAAAAKTALGA